LSLPFREVDAVVPTLLYLLAVVAAAALGRAWSGPVAATLSFLGLNFLFTPPVHTLRVNKLEDLVALIVFLAVSVIVGTLLARSLAERERVERREQEAAILHGLLLSLRSGEPIEEAMRTFALGMLRLFDLERCVIDSDAPGVVFAVSVPRAAPDPGTGAPVFRAALPPQEAGRMVLSRRMGGPAFGREERDVLSGMGEQVGSALERARLDAEVRKAHLDSETNQARAALFSSVTHDLRTPLASIKAAISSLMQKDVEFSAEERHDLLLTVHEETDRLNRLVGNLLDLSRDRAGVLKPIKMPTSLEEVINSLIRPDLPEIPLDPMQIDQVMTNLIENAVRFSPPGSEIAVAAARSGGMLQVRVADRGPGIPQEDREIVFEAFHTGSSRASGTGLGLAISRAIVETHDGRIWAEGTPGGGTTMVFELPLGTEPIR
jgi:two-component system sensor histidine kinase KdpD